MSRTLKVRGYHVMYDCSLRTLCCLPSVKKQKHVFNFFCSMYNKTIVRFSFCDIQNTRNQDKGYQPMASADNPYLDLDYFGYHKNLIQ